MGALGFMSKSLSSFLDMTKELDFGENARDFIVRRLMNIAIRSTYFVFCFRKKDWLDPELLNL